MKKIIKKIIKTLMISIINICLISTGYAIPEDDINSIDNQNNSFLCNDKSPIIVSNLYYIVKNIDNTKQTNQEPENCYHKIEDRQHHIKKEDHRRRQPWQIHH